ncbi:MAG: serine/threonine phosphatase [Spirulina sp. SIO3F2]|nr:serine/threonine phosphatase [Spirulina sp. SIO3F2]
MLVCPDCQFENPDTNNYCQRCGTSFIVRPCPDCGADVAWSAKDCPACGAQIASMGLAVWPSSSPPIPTEGQIDPEARYQRLDQEVAIVPDWVQVQVWDQQPLQKTYLERLLEQQDNTEGLVAASEDQDNANIRFWQQLGVSSAAIPYLVLQEALAPAIPVLQDTWNYQGQEIVLIEDRSAWTALLTVWQDETTPFSQLLYWLNETLRLWGELQKLQVCQSLQSLDNLCLDEDQTLCLRKLYIDPDGTSLSLESLGQVWQQLFVTSGRTTEGAIAELLSRLIEGEYQTVEELRQDLQAIAANQPNPADGEDPAQAADPTNPNSSEATTQPPENPEKMVYQGMGDDLPTVVLPMQLLSISDSGFTDIGEQRDHNEDHFGIETTVRRQENAMGKLIQTDGLYIVCDGMGGHAAGEVASAMAVETLQQYFQENWMDRSSLPDEAMITQAIHTANEKIYTVNMKNARSGSGRMGTTLVMVLVQDIHVAIAHVGDSRAYRVTRKHGIEQLTIDHEVGQREILRGVDPDDAYARPDAYQLTQALGPRDNDAVKPDVQYLELNEDTLLFLCSDGISDGDFLEEHFEDCLTPLISSRANLEQGVMELVDAANIYNGHDNLTGLAIRIKMRPNADPMGI